MVVAIYFVDEGDPGFGILVRAGNNAIPNVAGIDHPRAGRRDFLVSGQVLFKESVTVAKDQWVRCEAWEVIFANVNGVVVIGDRIIDCLGPWSTIELELKPFVVVDGVEKVVREVDRDIEVN